VQYTLLVVRGPHRNVVVSGGLHHVLGRADQYGHDYESLPGHLIQGHDVKIEIARECVILHGRVLEQAFEGFVVVMVCHE